MHYFSKKTDIHLEDGRVIQVPLYRHDGKLYIQQNIRLFQYLGDYPIHQDIFTVDTELYYTRVYLIDHQIVVPRGLVRV